MATSAVAHSIRTVFYFVRFLSAVGLLKLRGVNNNTRATAEISACINEGIILHICYADLIKERLS